MERLVVRPLTPERWADLKSLFGTNGACGGCWCMYSRLTNAEFEKRKGASNRRAFKRLVDMGQVPGVLGYVDDRPVAWCSIAPREAFPRLARSRVMKPVDDQPVWSITCLFLEKDHRQRGHSVALLEGAVEYASDQGAQIVEGYPLEPRGKTIPAVFAWWGTATAFLKAGFTEVARRSETRPVMRIEPRQRRRR